MLGGSASGAGGGLGSDAGAVTGVSDADPCGVDSGVRGAGAIEVLTAAEVAAFEAGLQACQTPEQGLRLTTTVAQMRSALIGLWATCQGSLLPALPNEVGQEFAANGDYFTLKRENGVLRRELGFHGAGCWWVLPDYATQVNIEFNFGGTVIVHPRFALSPRKTTMSNNGVYDGVWAAAP